MLREFAPSLWLVDGPTVSFYGFPYPTRMVIVRLASGDVWVWSPIAPTATLEREVESLGPVRHIVSPNLLHHLYLAEWSARWPSAHLYAPPGLARRRRDLTFHAELGDTAAPAWADDIDQVIFRGSFVMEEVVFLHRPSRTAIVGDLVQRFDPASTTGFKGFLMRLDGLVGEQGSAPREWRLTFLRRRATRAARDRVLGWAPRQLIVAHGNCAERDATDILRRALAWI